MPDGEQVGWAAHEDLNNVPNKELIRLMTEVRDGKMLVEDAVRTALASNAVGTSSPSRSCKPAACRKDSTSSLRGKHEDSLEEVVRQGEAAARRAFMMTVALTLGAGGIGRCPHASCSTTPPLSIPSHACPH